MQTLKMSLIKQTHRAGGCMQVVRSLFYHYWCMKMMTNGEGQLVTHCYSPVLPEYLRGDIHNEEDVVWVEAVGNVLWT